MKRAILIVLLAIQSIANGQEYEQTLNNIAIDNDLIGMSVLVMCNGSESDVFHYGLSDISTERPISERTYYRIASISKTITATALMQLYENGYFEIDDDINNYLDFNIIHPSYPDRTITFKHLLSHTSGLQDGSGYNNFLSASYSQTPPPHISELLTISGDYYTTDMFHNHQPGSYFTYSNINYGIIGTLIEQISGQRFDLYVRDSILLPLGITGSFNIDHISDIENVAVLYRNGNPQADNYQGTHPTPFDSAAYTVGTNGVIFAPQGGLRITAGDLGKFMAMHSNSGTFSDVEILKPETANLMHTPVWTYNGSNGNNYYNLFNSWGLGVQVTTNTYEGDIVIPETAMIGHAGEAYGLISDMYFEKEKQFGVIFLTNGYYSGGYSFGNNSAFYIPEEETFAAVNQYQYGNCDTISNSLFNITDNKDFIRFSYDNYTLHIKDQLQGGKLEIYNLAGQKIWNDIIEQNTLKFPLIQKGLFLVHYLKSEKQMVLKVLIQ
jgi:CubicO group peptidase (beta-lactamase class C family)